jgi:hypothetical protein
MRAQRGFTLMAYGALAAGLIIVVLSAAVAIQTKRVATAKAETAQVRAEHNQFVGGVEALGREATKEALERDLWNTIHKRKTDEENARSRAAADRTIAGLRADAAARDTRGGSLSEAPAGSKCPDGQTCFSTSEYQRALGEFDQEARRLADEGTSVTTDLNSAKRWAKP